HRGVLLVDVTGHGYVRCGVRYYQYFFFSSRRRHTRSYGDWSSDVCSSDLKRFEAIWPDTPGLGAHAFAVGERSVIFAGDYGAPSSITQYFPESGRSEMGHAIADGQQLEFTRAMG